jgi:LTXXQ motif family protein
MFPAGLRLAAFVVLSGVAATSAAAQHRGGPGAAPHAAPAPRAAPAPQVAAPRAAPQMAPRPAPQMAAPRMTPHTAAPRVAPQVHRPPQMAAPRAAPQQHARPAVRPPPAAITRQAPPTPKAFAGRPQPQRHLAAPPDRAQRRLAAPPDRGGSAAREAARPGPRDNLARQQPQGPQTVGAAERAGRAPLLSKPSQTYLPAGAGHRALAGRVLSNQSFASKTATRDPAGRALARATFQGSFVGRHWGAFASQPWRHRKHFPLIVIGWAGPLFWPYAYDDFVDYTFYPYAYDTFWPSAYDDVYAGLFGRYAYGAGDRGYPAAGYPAAGGHYAMAPRSARGGRTVAADVCGGETAGLTDWPIEQIAQTVGPDDAQRAALDELKSATTAALDILKASCPTELPSTPTGRMDAMHNRLDAMLAAVRTVRPALDRFYQSLNDEQKARFSALGPDDDREQQQTRRELTQACGERASGIGALPIERIEIAVRPDDAQRIAFKELQDATSAAVELLKSDCPTYRALTPVGRIEAMEQRLDAMQRAIETVQPALATFYGSLSPEQKERFNRLSPAQG